MNSSTTLDGKDMPIVFSFPSLFMCAPKPYPQLVRSLMSLLGLPPLAHWIVQTKQNKTPWISNGLDLVELGQLVLIPWRWPHLRLLIVLC